MFRIEKKPYRLIINKVKTVAVFILNLSINVMYQSFKLLIQRFARCQSINFIKYYSNTTSRKQKIKTLIISFTSCDFTKFFNLLTNV